MKVVSSRSNKPNAVMALALAGGSTKAMEITPKPSSGRRKPRFLELLPEALRSRHHSRRTEQSYCQWVERFIVNRGGKGVRNPMDAL